MVAPHPPLSPGAYQRQQAVPPLIGRHHAAEPAYVGRQNRVGGAPLSPVLPPGGRLRSRSYGSQPLGWSPSRTGPLSPSAFPGGKIVLHGLHDIPDDVKLNTSSDFPEPPVISEQQRAMEKAVQVERERAKAMEKEEASLTADELRTVLKRERHRMARIAADLAAVRSMNVQSAAEAEMSEEGRINCLMRRLEGLQQEKGRIIVELEREEEMVSIEIFCFDYYFVCVVFVSISTDTVHSISQVSKLL